MLNFNFTFVNTLIGLLIGIAVGVFATWFPGMLNMQSVATSLRAGRRKGFLFSGGLAVALATQVGITIIFAKFLAIHPEFIEFLKQSAIFLFCLLAVVFIIKGFRAREARKAEINKPYKGGPFWRGVGMGTMNLLNIPLFMAIGGWLSAAGYLPLGFWPRNAYVLGAGAGAMGVFSGYVIAAEWFNRRAAVFTRNINFFIGGFFILLVIIQGVQMI